MQTLTITFIAMLLFITCPAQQNSGDINLEKKIAQVTPDQYHSERTTGKLYVIEREIPDIGNMTAGELQKASKKSNNTLSNLGTEIKWIHSYVTDDKLYCIYSAQAKS